MSMDMASDARGSINVPQLTVSVIEDRLKTDLVYYGNLRNTLGQEAGELRERLSAVEHMMNYSENAARYLENVLADITGSPAPELPKTVTRSKY